MEGYPDGARKVLVPGVRDEHPAASALPRDAARLRRAQSAGHDPIEKFGQHQPLNRQSERYAREGIDLSLSTLAHRSAPVRRPCSRALLADRAPRSGRRAAARRRRHRADPSQGPGQGAYLDLCPQRSAIWRTSAAGRAVLRLARSTAGASRATSPKLQQHPAGRYLWRLAVRPIARAGTDHASALLGPRPAAVL